MHRNRVLAAIMVSVLMVWTHMAFAQDQSDEPQYGGDLNVVTVYRTLSALSWDTGDWSWKQNHDTGMVREMLISGDLKKSVRNGGPYPYTSDAYLPSGATLTGAYAEDDYDTHLVYLGAVYRF